MPAGAETLRLATFSPQLSRSGPGLVLAGLEKRGDAQLEAVLRVIAEAHPDVLLITDLDWDFRGQTLAALSGRLAQLGLDYPFHFAPQPNTGLDTGFDIDGNGVPGEPRDAQGYGLFTGQHGMAVLSRLPLGTATAKDFSAFLWQDLPGSQIEAATLPAGAGAVQRLSTTGHWDLAVETPAGPLQIWAWSATPPVFDGPEDRNGRRNADETGFWRHYLDGALPDRPAPSPFVLMGNANNDPETGAGQHEAIARLLADPRLQDPLAGRATADFGADIGPMRVDYILPSAGLRVQSAGVMAPQTAPPALREAIAAASDHYLVWVDIALP